MATQYLIIKDKEGKIIENPGAVAVDNTYIIDNKGNIIENKEFIKKERIIEKNKIYVE